MALKTHIEGVWCEEQAGNAEFVAPGGDDFHRFLMKG